MAREYMCAYHSMLDGTKKLTDEEFGQLMRGLLEYSVTGEEPEELPDKVQVAFDIYSGQIDRDNESYKAKCKSNRENISKRWNTTSNEPNLAHQDDTMVYDGIRTNTNDTKEKEKGKEKENRKEKGSNKRFSPPTLDEVAEYCRSRNSPVDPKKFYEYFSEGGWKDAKGQPVRNWKQKLLTWEKYDTKPPDPPERASSFDTDEFFNMAVEAGLKRTQFGRNYLGET